MLRSILFMLLGAIGAGGAAVTTAAVLPNETKSAAGVAQQLEAAGYEVVEISLDDGHWDAEVYKDGKPSELHVDASRGEIVSSHPDDIAAAPGANSLKLSKILTALEETGLTSVVDAELKGGFWEIEAYRGQSKHEVKVDTVSGKILAEHKDD